MSFLSKIFGGGDTEAAKRRRESRVEVRKGSYYRKLDGPGAVHECLIRDISRSGIGLSIHEPVSAGDRLIIIYEIAGSPQKEEIEIVRVTQNDYGCVFTAENPARASLPF